MPPTSQDYNYTSSGIDDFLSRSIDQVSWQSSLDSTIAMPGSGALGSLPAPQGNNATRFDATQTTGSMGDTLQVGNITIDGINGAISVTDPTTDNIVVQIGNISNG